MSEEKISVIKSPVVPMPDFSEEPDYEDHLVYYVYLSNGLIVTKPDDFPADKKDHVKEIQHDEPETSKL